MAIAKKTTETNKFPKVGTQTGIPTGNAVGKDIHHQTKDNVISTSRIVDVDTRIINQRAYLQQGNWTGNWYGQVKESDDLTTNLDMLNSIVGNNYYTIEDLSIKVTTPLETGTANVSFSAVLPTGVYPIVGDIFVAKTISGHVGMFRVTNKTLNTYSQNPVYTIEAKLDRLVRDDPAIFKQLETKVIRKYVSSNGMILKHNDYTRYSDVTEAFLNIKDHYTTNYLRTPNDIPYDALAQHLLGSVTDVRPELPNFVTDSLIYSTIVDVIVHNKPLHFVTKRSCKIGKPPKNLNNMHFRFKNAMQSMEQVVLPIKSERKTHVKTTYVKELNQKVDNVAVDVYVKPFTQQVIPTVVGTPVVAVLPNVTITYVDNGLTRTETRVRTVQATDVVVKDKIANAGDVETITTVQTFENEVKTVNNVTYPLGTVKLVKQVITISYKDTKGKVTETVRETDLTMKDFDKTVCLSPIVAKLTKITKDVVITQITPVVNPPISNTTTNNITITTTDLGNQRIEVKDTPLATITRTQDLELWGNQIGVTKEVIDTVFKDGSPTTHVEFLDKDANTRIPIILQIVPPVVVPDPIVTETKTVKIERISKVVSPTRDEYSEVIVKTNTTTPDATKSTTVTTKRIQEVSTPDLTVLNETLTTTTSFNNGDPDTTTTITINPVSTLIDTTINVVSNEVNGIKTTSYDGITTRKEVKVDSTGANVVTTTREQEIDLETDIVTKEIITTTTKNPNGDLISKDIKVLTSNLTLITLQVPIVPAPPVIKQITPIPDAKPITNAVGTLIITTIDNGSTRTEITHYADRVVKRVQTLVLKDDVLTVTDEQITTTYTTGVPPEATVTSVLPVQPITLQIEKIVTPIYRHINPTVSSPIVPYIYHEDTRPMVGTVPNDFVSANVTTTVTPTTPEVLPKAVSRYFLLPQHIAGDDTYLIPSTFYDDVTNTLFEEALLQLITNKRILNIEALLDSYMDLTDSEQYTYGPYLLAFARYWSKDTLGVDLT